MPPEFVDFLIRNAVRDELPFPSGCGGIWTPDDIMVLNEQEAPILQAGLFAIGNAINGDFIVIDLTENSNQVGFVSHDELWENAPEDVRDIFAPVDESIHEMLAAITLELRARIQGLGIPSNYPIDYCSALERDQSA